MKEIFIGEYIKYRRQSLGLTQKDVCSGICEPVTISRLENGKQTPSRNIINALLQRLDLPADRYFALLSDHEIEIERLHDSITALNIQFERSIGVEKSKIQQQAFEKIAKLEQATGEKDRITQQFILRSRVLLGTENCEKYPLHEQLAMLMDALCMTVPKFDLARISKCLYSLEEIKILNHIASIYDAMGQYAEANNIYSQLLGYVQKHHQNMLQASGQLPMIAHNYARSLNIQGRNQEALEIAELARQSCIRNRNYQMMPRILHTMAVTRHDLGEHALSRKLYLQAYHVCTAIDDKSDLTRLQEDAWVQYRMEFED